MKNNDRDNWGPKIKTTSYSLTMNLDDLKLCVLCGGTWSDENPCSYCRYKLTTSYLPVILDGGITITITPFIEGSRLYWYCRDVKMELTNFRRDAEDEITFVLKPI